jgi:hypothetical protein
LRAGKRTPSAIMSTVTYKLGRNGIKSIRYIVRGAFLIYFVYLLSQIIFQFQKGIQGAPNIIEMPVFYNLIFFLLVFAVTDKLINYFQNTLNDLIQTTNDRILGTVISYNNKLTVRELAQKFGLKENELEKILAEINMQGEYSIRIDKDTGLITATSIASLVGSGTKEERLQKLEELFREGKISERTFKSLKEKYSKES